MSPDPLGSSDGHNVCSSGMRSRREKATRTWGPKAQISWKCPLLEKGFFALCLDAPWARCEAQSYLEGRELRPLVSLPLPQDCLKACQEQIEAALAESLKQASQTPQELRASKSAAYPGSQPTGTPTDVTDVNL